MATQEGIKRVRPRGITMTDRVCGFCKNAFKTRLAYVKRGGGIFCSDKCRSDSTRGKPFSPSHRANLSGPRAGAWKGGVSSPNELIRRKVEYKFWRKAVYERDNYTCQECGDRTKVGFPVKLNAHHIKPFSLFPELRFAIDNGITLCVKCHYKTDTFGCKVNRKLT